MRERDVLVIGGGPAGVAAATELAMSVRAAIARVRDDDERFGPEIVAAEPVVGGQRQAVPGGVGDHGVHERPHRGAPVGRDLAPVGHVVDVATGGDLGSHDGGADRLPAERAQLRQQAAPARPVLGRPRRQGERPQPPDRGVRAREGVPQLVDPDRVEAHRAHGSSLGHGAAMGKGGRGRADRLAG